MAASTVAQYLAALPADRRAALSAVRKAINENLPDGYEEGMQFGMIGWHVPLFIYPAGYGENPKVPLPLVALASQKSGMVLHFLCFYGHPTLSTWFTSEYQKSGKKLDMGKVASASKSWRTWLSTWSAAPLRACPWKSTWPITGQRERSWARAVTRVKERPGFPVTDCGANGRAFQEQRKEGRQEVRGEEEETKEVTLATIFSEKSRLCQKHVRPRIRRASPSSSSRQTTRFSRRRPKTM